MKITQDAGDLAAAQGIAWIEALEKGLRQRASGPRGAGWDTVGAVGPIA